MFGDTNMEYSDMRRPASEVPVKNEEDLDRVTESLSRIPGAEYVSTRPGPGQKKLYYLSGESSTRLANEVFGVNGWSCETRSVTLDSIEETGSGLAVYATAIVRVIFMMPNKYGKMPYHEDVGTGSAQAKITNSAGAVKLKADAIDHAKKGAVTDARKRAMRQFGNVLGMFLHDEHAVKFSQMQRGERVQYEAHRATPQRSRLSSPGLFVSSRENGQRPQVQRRRVNDVSMGGVTAADQASLEQIFNEDDWDVTV
jgi:DNA recombination protein Rad52